MTFKFPSDEWMEELAHQLNESAAYERAAKDWEGDFIFVVESDETYPETEEEPVERKAPAPVQLNLQVRHRLLSPSRQGFEPCEIDAVEGGDIPDQSLVEELVDAPLPQTLDVHGLS